MRPDSSELDEEGCDHDGFCWAGTGWESICEYKMIDVMRDEEAAREIARLRAEVEALRLDAERLDWLDKNVTRVSDSERYFSRHVYWGAGTNKNVRQAIDSARSKDNG